MNGSRSGAQPALQAHSLSKRYGTIQALDGVSLSLKAGEWVGLLGANGAGKTTLMKAIAGLIEVDSGSFELLGQRVVPSSARARSLLGVVPQEIALYRSLTALENLRLFGSLHGVDRRGLQSRVEWALEWAGLGSRASQRVERLSGGMQRRLNIACAVLHEPRVVLLDEPTVGVDPQARLRIWSMLDELRGGGASLIHSSHQLHEIESTCDRVVIMDHGRFLASGSPRDLVLSAFGTRRSISLRFSSAPGASLLGPEFELNGTVARGAIDDIARELPRLLLTCRDAGHEIRDIHVGTPSLEEVFTSMTGRELRE